MSGEMLTASTFPSWEEAPDAGAPCGHWSQVLRESSLLRSPVGTCHTRWGVVSGAPVDSHTCHRTHSCTPACLVRTVSPRSRRCRRSWYRVTDMDTGHEEALASPSQTVQDCGSWSGARLPVSLLATLERPCPGGMPGNGPGNSFADPFGPYLHFLMRLLG